MDGPLLGIGPGEVQVRWYSHVSEQYSMGRGREKKKHNKHTKIQRNDAVVSAVEAG